MSSCRCFRSSAERVPAADGGAIEDTVAVAGCRHCIAMGVAAGGLVPPAPVRSTTSDALGTGALNTRGARGPAEQTAATVRGSSGAMGECCGAMGECCGAIGEALTSGVGTSVPACDSGCDRTGCCGAGGLGCGCGGAARDGLGTLEPALDCHDTGALGCVVLERPGRALGHRASWAPPGRYTTAPAAGRQAAASAAPTRCSPPPPILQAASP